MEGMDLKNFDSIDLDTIEKFDPHLSSNVKSLIEDGSVHELYYQEYEVKIYLILSLMSGEFIRIHLIDKTDGTVSDITLIGEEWKVVKEMMKIYKGKSKKTKSKKITNVVNMFDHKNFH
jgi:hypothetical protein